MYVNIIDKSNTRWKRGKCFTRRVRPWKLRRSQANVMSRLYLCQTKTCYPTVLLGFLSDLLYIAIIAKPTLQKLPGNSSLNVPPGRSCQMSVLSGRSCQTSRQMTCLKRYKIAMVVFATKLEVVHKQGEGCLISYNLQLASVRKWWLSDPMRAHRSANCSE